MYFSQLVPYWITPHDFQPSESVSQSVAINFIPIALETYINNFVTRNGNDSGTIKLQLIYFIVNFVVA
jgi:hypothetical protein